MARSNPPARTRARSAGPPPEGRELAVGRPMQARLIALEKQVGLFSEEQSFAADSRFNHPMIVLRETPLPAHMQHLFADDLAGLERLGGETGRGHAAELGPYRVHCISYFHYDGFRALVYVERDGSFVAAWKEQEVLQPDSPRTLWAGVDDHELEAFLACIPGV